MSWISDTLGSLGSSVGGSNGILANSAPYAILGLLNYLSSENNAKYQEGQTKDTREFTAAENQKNRDFQREMEMLSMGQQAKALAAQAAATKGGLINSAYGNAQSSALGGGQMQVSTLMQMINAIQNGLGKV